VSSEVYMKKRNIIIAAIVVLIVIAFILGYIWLDEYVTEMLWHDCWNIPDPPGI
jgi:hypothetical protein